MEETLKKFNLRVTEDRVAVLLDCDVTGVEFNTLVVAVGKQLEALGIKDPPDQKQLKEQLHHATEGNPHLEDFVLIKGKLPVPPQHGRVDWEGDLFNTGFVADKETGKINYRDKAAHESVTKGALLGSQTPAKEGEDGIDVFGEPIHAEEPESYYPEVGENVRFDTNKKAYYAERNGRVRMVNDTLFVDEVYTITEDVDITTGDILHTGAVVVNRDVLNGAKIEAAGNIEVHGNIENAEIRTNGDLTVRGGIRQSEDHRIVAEGTIYAKYIDGGSIQAKKDIVVEKEIINATLQTLGAVIIPRGSIVGGEIVALRGIFAGCTGSRASIPTMLVAGEDFSVRGKRNLKKIKRKRLEEELTQHKNYADSQMSRHNATFTYSSDVLTKVFIKISELERELQAIIEEMKDIESQSLDRAKKVVLVKDTLYPNTIICFDDERLTIAEEYAGPIQAEIVDGKIKLDKGDTSLKS